MPTQTFSRSPPQSHPRAMSHSHKSPSALPPMAYPAPLPYHHRSSATSTSPPSSKGHHSSSSRHHRGNSTTTSAVPSLVSDRHSSSDGGLSDVDLLDMLDLKLSHTVKAEPLDRGIVKQAQASGELNAKQRELAELQALASRRLKGARANFADGQKAAKEVKRDLEWTQKKVNSLKTKTEKRYPEQYRKAHAR